MCRSVPQIEAVFTRTSTSVGPVAGTATVSICRPFAACIFRNAFIVVAIYSSLVQRANPDASTPFLGLSIVPLCMPSLCSVGASAPTAFSLQTFNLQTFNGLASPAPLPRSSSAPSNTPPPSPLAPAHTPPKLHLQSAAHSVSHPQNSAPHTHTLPPLPTVPHNSVASASPLPPPLRDPQNSR